MRAPAAVALFLAASMPLSATAYARAQPADSRISDTWVLREIDGRPAVADAKTTMRVSEGRITGSGGCNSYSGLGRIADGRVSVGLLAMTKMGCEPDVLEQEARFASALPASVRYEIDPSGVMRVYDAQGRLTMRLTRAR
ncbi:MAG: META domain-containing protein [Beijerinckiaceae bacterium]